MGFKDLPGGQNDKGKKGLADFAKELAPKPKDAPKNK
jgi:hypothetical protein